MRILSRFFVALFAFGAASLFLTKADAQSVKVEHLGINNTLVRVTTESRYVILPVQDSCDDAPINILVDGKTEKSINVKLAQSKVDYYVPLDISQYKGHSVALMATIPGKNRAVRDSRNDVCWKNITLSNTFDTTNWDKYRPVYHHTPLYGWMNDPNGMVYKDGVWHLYYQHNPWGSKWENLSWGHSSSTDLVNWKHHEEALEPNGLGMIFSGSSAVDTKNSVGAGKDAIVSLFTSAGVSQTQSLAWSKDNGETFTVYPENPVLSFGSEARDPNMFWNDEKGEWILVLAHALEHEMLIFTSKDMKEWTLQSSFGKGIGAQGGVWECPDLFEVPVDGTNVKKWVLICNINPGGLFGGSAAQYFVGDFDGKTFKADTDANGNIPTKWLDFGKDNYADVSWSDAPNGRRTIIGWMSNWDYAKEVPTLQFRSANTLPREVELFTGPDGSLYVSTAPSPEVTVLRDKPSLTVAGFSAGKNVRTYQLPTANDGICEILMDVKASKNAKVNISIGNNGGEKVVMVFDASANTLSVDRRESGDTSFSSKFAAVTSAPTFTTNGSVKLRVFIDKSSIEVFGNDGKFAVTDLVFPKNPYTTLSVSAEGGSAKVANLKVYPLSLKK